jgi:hypothetical protein
LLPVLPQNFPPPCTFHVMVILQLAQGGVVLLLTVSVSLT